MPDAPSPIREISTSDLKRYPHFDAPLSISEIKKLVSDPSRVRSNAFYPLMLFYEEWQPYRITPLGKPEKKSRPIRFASRRDSYIFSHYRKILSTHYEKRLNDLEISHCPIAYRRIGKTDGPGGKCNIDFAKDAFNNIRELRNCIAIGLDIKSYFERIEHNGVYKIWCDFLNVERLPADHYAVFKNITRYHYVEQVEVYRRLGYIGPISRGKFTYEGFLMPRNKIPTQLCSPKDFREKICGDHPHYSNIIKHNPDNFGIPQGAPISDLIANFYLLDFDIAIEKYIRGLGGFYMRYSDDILLIIPDKTVNFNEVIDKIKQELQSISQTLEIKDEKTIAVRFWEEGTRQQYENIGCGRVKNGFEYLGFRYDGSKVFIRDGTISNFYRKVSVAARREAYLHVQRNPNSDSDSLKHSFNWAYFIQKFGRVENFSYDNSKTWTFYTYLKRAEKIFGRDGDRIREQLQNFRDIAESRVYKYIDQALNKK